MNVLADPVLTLSGGDKVSLPGLFAAMARDEVRGFAALRPHQRPAWHMFLVQLAALSLWTADRKIPPRDAASWASALRGLTPDYDDDAPWQLAVTDRSKPAFMQAPIPQGLKWSGVSTPDELDMLITARNHDVKRAIARGAAPEDWVYALVSLQTCEGYGGRGNNGIARMNGGSSSRPLLGLAPARHPGNVSVDPSAWWSRDVKGLLDARRECNESGSGRLGGHSLLWCLDWSEDDRLDLRDLDPWFIEICRRVRLSDREGRLSAMRSTSKAPRIDAKAFKGNTGDPWTPVHSDGRSLTLGSGDFHYRRLCNLLFSGDWTKPLLARPRNDEIGDMLLVAEAFARGNSKTEGFKSRVVPVPGAAVALFSAETVGSMAGAQVQEIETFDTSLRNALALLGAGGISNQVEKKHYGRALPAQRRFDYAADRLFFPSLWRRVAASTVGMDDAEKAKRDFLLDLWRAVNVEFEAAAPAVPCPSVLRSRAVVRARRALRNRVWKEFPELFEPEHANESA